MQRPFVAPVNTYIIFQLAISSYFLMSIFAFVHLHSIGAKENGVEGQVAERVYKKAIDHKNEPTNYHTADLIPPEATCSLNSFIDWIARRLDCFYLN